MTYNIVSGTGVFRCNRIGLMLI